MTRRRWLLAAGGPHSVHATSRIRARRLRGTPESKRQEVSSSAFSMPTTHGSRQARDSGRVHGPACRRRPGVLRRGGVRRRGVHCRSLVSTSRFYREMAAAPVDRRAFQKAPRRKLHPDQHGDGAGSSASTAPACSTSRSRGQRTATCGRASRCISRSPSFPACSDESASSPPASRATSRRPFDPESGCGPRRGTCFRISRLRNGERAACAHLPSTGLRSSARRASHAKREKSP